MKLSQEEFDNLSALMLSTDDANTRMALTMLVTQGLDDETKCLLTEIFVVYKTSSDTEVQQQASDILKRLGSKVLKNRMNRRFVAESSTLEETISYNIIQDTARTELDPLKFAKALYLKSGKGLAFLLKKLRGDEARDFLEKFILGTRFSLINKRITSLPKAFYEFSFLTEIDLSGNALSAVHKQFKAFAKLRSLDVSKNKIENLPQDFTKLTKLEYLNLAGNQFADFPEVLAALPNLRELNIKQFAGRNNKVRLVHESFFGVKTLQKLILGEPDLHTPRDYQCHQMDNYPLFHSIEVGNTDEYLDLSPLAAAKKAFKDHRQAVGYLFKHGNSETINEVIKAFYDEKTKTLDLSYHCIVNVPEELLQWDVRSFSLAHARIGYNGGWRANNMEQLLEGIARYMPNLEKLDISHNAMDVQMDITPLFKLNKLKELRSDCVHSIAHKPMMQKIKEALPDCKII